MNKPQIKISFLMKRNICFILLSIFAYTALSAQNRTYEFKENISYVMGKDSDEYKKERCKLDIYYPSQEKDYPTIIWFHGGGIEGGEKHIPDQFKNKELAVVAVNYRLSPRAAYPSYIEDTAEAIAWVVKNIENYGGDKRKIFVSGHSAGGYLALMAQLDKSYMQAYGIDANFIAGWAPISGQTNTHYTIRKERGLPHPATIPVIDKYAPINQARDSIAPTLLITGDRKLEMTGRWEENAHLLAVLKAMGNNNVELFELEGFNHGTVLEPGCILIVDWIRSQLRSK